MKHPLTKRFLSWMIVLAMVLGFVPAVQAESTVHWKESDVTVTAMPEDRIVEKDESGDGYAATDLVRVSIVLEGASTIEAGYSTMGIAGNADAMAYNADLKKVQARMEKTISAAALGGKALDVVWNMTLVGNIISAWVPYGSLDAIRAIPGVKAVEQEAQYEPCVAEQETVDPTVYTSSAMIGSGQLWNSGITGAGTKIAVIDTGTDATHQSFDNDAFLYALAENAAGKGMTTEEYMASLELMDAEAIAAVLPNLNLYEMDPSITAEQLYSNEKLAFSYNYVDGNLNTNHMNDYQGEHGSHVAGISLANRYISNGSEYVDAGKNCGVVGVAPDAQLITMKVFGEESPFDSDYMAAIEDAIWLGCDAVNLSLGTTAPGSPVTTVYADLLEMMTETDTVVVISAGNNGTWAAASLFGYSYADDVVTNTVGSPGSYASALTVASVENDGTVGYYFTAGGVDCFYHENLDYGNPSLVTLDTSLNLDGTDYEYVYLDGLGYESEYEDIDVSGKVVFVSRGTLNFGVKANNAAARGAVAVVIYNNTDGMHNMDLTGLGYAVPVVSLLQADALAVREASQRKTTASGNVYYTGTLTVMGLKGATSYGSAYYEMSSFSSWGVPGDLSLKPEITAPGGGIYSVWGTTPSAGGSDQYVSMSGTSMAAPQVTGMAALLAQHYRENGMEESSGLSARHLAQSLLMSTAQPLYEEASGGNYYSLLNQGAGLARVDLAAAADSYVLVEGQEDGKVKAELGDDPQRTGEYAFTFTLNNLTDTEQVYALRADAFRQDVFEYIENSEIWLLDTWTTGLEATAVFTSGDKLLTSALECDLNGDGVTNDADADHLLEYLAGNERTLHADADLSGDGVVNTYDAHLLLAKLAGSACITLPASGSVQVTVRLTLSDAAKAQIEAENPKGAFVQAFVYAEAVADAEGQIGTAHSIPMLAYYGDWSEPSMFDRGTLVEHIYMAVNTGPYLYYFVGPYGNALSVDYGSGTEYYFGGNPILDDEAYLPERNAISSTSGMKLVEQNFSLIRSAGAARLQVVNAETGDVYFERQLGELYPAYYNPSYGTWENTIQYATLKWSGTDAEGKPLAEGTKVEVRMTAASYYSQKEDGTYDLDSLGEGSTLCTPLTIDNTAPEALDIDLSQLDGDKLTVTAQDNQYVAAVALLNATGTKFLAVQSPNQTEANAQVTVELDLTEVYGNSFLVVVYDYANNSTVYEVELNLGSPDRDYFTAIDYQSMNYVSVAMDGSVSKIAETGLPVLPRAAEYVGGYVFIVTQDNSLCVANDEDLTATRRIAQLDPNGEWLITYFNDMAYNYVDGKLYGQFYSQLNYEAAPYLCTIDMTDGSLDVVCELPVDVNTMAIDGEGNFYSSGYGTASLYTYTLESVTSESPSMTYIGETGYYYSSSLSSLAWDHNADKLYWAFPNTLLELNPRTAEPTLLGYHTALLIGLYTRPEESEGRFDPVDTVDRMELSHTDTRVMLNASITLEATVWPWNASDRTVTWTSSDQGVATVDANGVVTGVSEGSCTITATSNLDPTVSVSCAIQVFRMEKTLNALIWDENGEIWMSEFSTDDIPNYTKLSTDSLGKDLAAATWNDDGTLYAASLDSKTMKSSLYTLDPDTYKPTKIGDSSDAYMDLAPAPGMPGESLMAVYGGNILNVDATTGDYYNWYYMFSYNLVGLAYVGTEPYTDWGYNTMVDWYFIIDRVGYVYLMGFLEQDGSYYYLEHDALAPGGIYTKLDFEMETPYFGSAYFDGQFLYYSAYKQSRNNVTLMAIDVAGGSKACYELGTFADGVWPVAGVMELGKTGGDISIIHDYRQTETMSRPVPVEESVELNRLEGESAQGGLNSAGGILPLSDSQAKDDKLYVNVTMPANGTNGVMVVGYDPAVLKLTEVDGMTTAFASSTSDGQVQLYFAEASTLLTGETVARLTFQAQAEGETTLVIRTTELNEGASGYVERLDLTVSTKCPSESFEDVNEGDWWHEAVDYVVEKGYMNGMDTTHFGPGLTMNRAQFVTVLYRMENEPAVNNTGVFTDVPDGQFYTEAAYWALEAGITTGATATTFNPGGQLTRTELVTFMYRYAAYKGYDTTATADLSVYRDESRILSFAVEPWRWAVTHGIVTGVTADTLAPMNLTNRAQAATIFQRLDSKFA